MNFVDVIVADRNSGVELSRYIVVLLGEFSWGFAQVLLQLLPQCRFDVLDRAGANHDEETRPFEAKRTTYISIIPPGIVFLEERIRIYNVVVEIDAFEKVLDKRVCHTESAFVTQAIKLRAKKSTTRTNNDAIW